MATAPGAAEAAPRLPLARGPGAAAPRLPVALVRLWLWLRLLVVNDHSLRLWLRLRPRETLTVMFTYGDVDGGPTVGASGGVPGTIGPRVGAPIPLIVMLTPHVGRPAVKVVVAMRSTNRLSPNGYGVCVCV